MINELLIDEIQDAQKFTNFVLLMPTLPDAYVLKNITLKKETNEQRSSIRFEIHNKGKVLRIKQSFTTCSFTARYNKSKWGFDDEISRVSWYEANKRIGIEESLGIKLPNNHNEFFLDSIGYKNYDSGTEYHFLYRSNKDFTNGFWLWIAPTELSDPLPSSTGHKIGTRQSWNIKKVSGSILHIPVKEIIMCRQNTKYKSWMIHWEKDNYIYHFYSRANIKNNIRDFQSFLSKLHSN